MALNKIRFIHFADLHLDAPFRDEGKEGYSILRRRELQEALERIIRLSEEEGVQFILISGDLFEHHYTSKTTIAWLSGLFSKVTLPIIITPGNHDPYVADSWYRVWSWPLNVMILHEGRPSVTLEACKTHIYGSGFSSFRQEKPDLIKVDRPKEGYFNILMLHGTLDMSFANTPYNQVTSQELEVLGYDYYALGHFHNRKQNYSLKNAANPGSPEPLGFDEKGEHGVLLVQLEETPGKRTLEIQEINLSRRIYMEKTLDISACNSHEEVRMRILAAVADLKPEKHLVRLVLRGRTALDLSPEMLKQMVSDEWLYFKLINETQSLRDYEALSQEQTLKGAFIREMLDRIKRCDTSEPERVQALMRALELGLEAIENGKIESLREN